MSAASSHLALPLQMKVFRWFLVILLIGLGLAFYWFISNSRARTQTPEYVVIRKDGPVEIRDYPDLRLVTAPMQTKDMNGPFGMLFRYITGSNGDSTKIAMTTPVLIDNTPGEKTMSFILPEETVKTGVPTPTGDGVRLNHIPAARFAALRFQGSRSSETETKALETLRGWLASQKLTSQGEPLFAYYDPPWTPVPMRRNEVFLRLKALPERP